MTQAMARARWHLAVMLIVAVSGSLASNAAASEQTGWFTDSAHTEINFSVKHFFTPVTGSFEDFEIELDYDPLQPETSSIEARIRVASVNTGNEKRDNHLRTADWFEADKYPYMTFKSTTVRQVAENRVVASGPLTIKGQSHDVELPITLLGRQMIPGEMQQMLGGTKEVASFQASTTIDRGDFDVGVGSWAATMVVGGEVSIEILLEAHSK
jgi:polyisoprenoid-binding protein YceI